MEQIIEVFQYDWAIRALVASTLVGIVCGVLGCFIVLRNMSMIGDALSHAILPGVVAGFIVAGHSILAMFTGSVLAGLVTAILITLIQRNIKTKEDAAIGIVFTSMFALGVMGISWVSRQEGVHLDMKDFLFGNILGISDQDLWLTGALTIYVSFSIIIFYRYFFATTFQSVVATTMGINVTVIHYFLMLLLSFTVVASLQSVGVILVVAMLIIPASTAQLLTRKLNHMILVSACVGMLSAVLGLLIAILLETTPGPAMTLTSAAFYGLAVFFAPVKGLLPSYLLKQRRRRKILIEDILKQSLKLSEQGLLTKEQLLKIPNYKSGSVKSLISYLIALGDLAQKGNKIELTKSGSEKANNLVRAHRLWETYMVEKMGQKKEEIHESAEKYEHGLTDQLIEEMEEKLGYPEKDPHGSPIPRPSKSNTEILWEIEVGSKLIIPESMSNEHLASELWHLGLLADTELEVVSKEDEIMKIRQNKKVITLSQETAELIDVQLVE